MLARKCKRCVTCSERSVRVHDFRLFFDSCLLKQGSVIALKCCSNIEHTTSTFQFPSHTTSLHAIFDELSASAFDYARCNRVSRFEILVVLHTGLIVLEVVADLFKFIQFFTLSSCTAPIRRIPRMTALTSPLSIRSNRSCVNSSRSSLS